MSITAVVKGGPLAGSSVPVAADCCRFILPKQDGTGQAWHRYLRESYDPKAPTSAPAVLTYDEQCPAALAGDTTLDARFQHLLTQGERP